MQKLGYGPNNPLRVKVSARNISQYRDPAVILIDQLKKIYKDGFAWVDAAMKSHGAASFAGATAAQQTALLDQIAYRRNQSPELGPGIEFFSWVRRMTVDGFYTSPIGMRDIYPGNTPRAEDRSWHVAGKRKAAKEIGS